MHMDMYLANNEKTEQPSFGVLSANQSCRIGWLPLDLKRIPVCLYVELKSQAFAPSNGSIATSCLAIAPPDVSYKYSNG